MPDRLSPQEREQQFQVLLWSHRTVARVRTRDSKTAARLRDALPRLCGLVCIYSPGGQWDTFRDLRRQGRTFSVTEARDRYRDLERAFKTAERILKTRRTAVLVHAFMGGLAPWPGMPPDFNLGRFVRDLAIFRQRVSALAQKPRNGRARNRPADPWRLRFVRGVRAALEDAGISTRGRRDGLFAAVLSVCFQAADEEPSHLDRLIARADRAETPTRS